jgi:hypothetical protein
MQVAGAIFDQRITARNALDPTKGNDSMSSDEREIMQARWQFLESVMMGYSHSHSKEAQGLYLVTKPRLGLAHHGS